MRLIIQQSSIEHLLYVRHYSRFPEYSNEQEETFPTYILVFIS